MGTDTQNQYITAWGEYLLGYIHYQRNELKTAVCHFSQAIEWRFFMDLNSPIDNYAGLALAYQAMQHPGKANEDDWPYDGIHAAVQENRAHEPIPSGQGRADAGPGRPGISGTADWRPAWTH